MIYNLIESFKGSFPVRFISHAGSKLSDIIRLNYNNSYSRLLFGEVKKELSNSPVKYAGIIIIVATLVNSGSMFVSGVPLKIDALIIRLVLLSFGFLLSLIKIDWQTLERQSIILRFILHSKCAESAER